MTATPCLLGDPGRILRHGHAQAVEFGAPEDMKERLWKSAIDAEAMAKMTPSFPSYPMFEHLNRQHGLTLTESQIFEIYEVARKNPITLEPKQ